MRVQKLKHWLFAMLFATTVGGSVFATVPQQVSAADPCNTSNLLMLPPWYRGLTDGDCNFQAKASISDTIWIIALNIIEMVLYLVAYISVGFIIYGGYLFMIGTGSPDKIVGARKTILNAVIGLVLSFFSVAIVKLVVSRFTEI